MTTQIPEGLYIYKKTISNICIRPQPGSNIITHQFNFYKYVTALPLIIILTKKINRYFQFACMHLSLS
jgi:hypothetical protein